MKTLVRLVIITVVVTLSIISKAIGQGVSDAADFGFFSNATGVENVKSFQKALDQGGSIILNQPGIY